MKKINVSKTYFFQNKFFAKFLMVMKITVLLLFFAVGSAFAKPTYSQNTRLSLHLEHATLQQVFEEIQKKSEFIIFYKDNQVDVNHRSDLDLDDATVNQILDQALISTDLGYKIIDRQIVIMAHKSKESPSVIKSEISSAQQKKEISGIVKDSKGQPLPGVSVVIKGTTSGTITDTDGKFKINVPSDAKTLVFSFVGMKTQDLLIGANSIINVTLIEEVVGLTEVVAVGYGNQKRGALTSAISVIKGDILQGQPVADLSNSIAGRSSGIIATQSSGEPGSDGSNILIRGISTIGNSQPLVIVDGVPRNYAQLDPNSIASISILKDAAAVAPYGMAGANGVILITTKKGKTGAPSLSYNGYAGWQNPTVLTKFVNSYQYASLMNAAKDNEGASHVYSEADLQAYKNHTDPNGHQDNNVLKELITPNAMITKHNLELSGGTEKVNYFAALGYLSQDGMWGPTNYKRYNLTSNIDIHATKYTEVSLSINGRVEDRNSPAVSSYGIFYQAFRTPPIAPVKFSNGLPGGWIGSSVYGNIFDSGYTKNLGYTLLNQFSIEQQLPFIKGLSVKAVLSYDYNPGDSSNPGSGISSFERQWVTPIPFYTLNTSTTPYSYTQAGNGGPSKPQYYENFTQNQAFTYQAYLNYHNTFGKNDIRGLIVLEERNTKFNTFGASRLNYDVLLPELNNGSSASIDIGNNGYSSEGKQESGLYRLSYAYAGKYLLEASGRYDGNYYFAPGKRFGFFPAFSAGWRVSDEKFIKDKFTWINNLKIRGSYGESGALAGTPFQYLRSYSLYSGASVIAGNPTTGMVENSEPNINITWERAKKTNIGFEASFWNGLITVEADYFQEKRSNMLASPNIIVPIEYGVGISQKNAASMSNKGFEIALGSSHKFSDDLLVSLSINATFVKNKLEQIYENTVTYNNPNRRVTGRPIGTQFGWKAIGFFKPEDFNQDGSLKPGIPTQSWGKVHPGDIRYEDTYGPNGKPDGIIDNNDIVPIGKSFVPEIIYGISPSIIYKGFDLNMLLQGAANRDFYLTGAGAWPFYSSSSATIDNMDYWTPTHQNATNPRITSSPAPNNMVASSFWVRNGSYLRLKTAQIGYTIPASVVQRIKVKSLRVYVSGQNLITWSPIKNFDPEVSDSQGMYYPQQKVVSVGLNVTF